jgi:DNA-directed RNA polymerase specialized sigma subunit
MILEEKVVSFRQTGDSSLGQEILTQSYQLAEAIVYSKYKNFGYTDDLLSESHDAIISAIYAFKPDKKTKFLTFCSTCINNRIKNFIKKKKTGEKYNVDKRPMAYYSECRIDITNSLGELSDNHLNALLKGEGSKSMKFRAKKKLLNKLNGK